MTVVRLIIVPRQKAMDRSRDYFSLMAAEPFTFRDLATMRLGQAAMR
jgi:hypothetical protein